MATENIVVKYADRFWSRVALTANPDKCWNWIGAVRDGNNRGAFSYNGKTGCAYRFSYILNKGDVPEGLCVLHKCDNPLCVNPNHLFIGTNADNSNDMVKKGRQAKGLRSGRYTKPERTARGERCRHAKLTSEKVLDIKKKELTSKEYAQKYGVIQDTITLIWRGKIWKHIN